MKKIDPTVLKETAYIAAFSFVLGVLMQAVFLIVGRWDVTVLLGGILGYLATVGNFFLMGLTVQKAVTKDQKEAKKLIRLSQMLRFLFLVAVAALGYLVSSFNLIAVVIPYLFSRIAIAARPLFKNF